MAVVCENCFLYVNAILNDQIKEPMLLTFAYSYLSNKRTGWNTRGFINKKIPPF